MVATASPKSNVGKITQVIGPVVDVEFADGNLPALLNALTVDYTLNGKPAQLTMEVQQHLGEGWVRAVAMSLAEGLKRAAMKCTTPVPRFRFQWVKASSGASSTGSALRPTNAVRCSSRSDIGFIAPLPRCLTRTPSPRCWRPASRSLT